MKTKKAVYTGRIWIDLSGFYCGTLKRIHHIPSIWKFHFVWAQKDFHRKVIIIFTWIMHEHILATKSSCGLCKTLDAGQWVSSPKSVLNVNSNFSANNRNYQIHTTHINGLQPPYNQPITIIKLHQHQKPLITGGKVCKTLFVLGLCMWFSIP